MSLLFELSRLLRPQGQHGIDADRANGGDRRCDDSDHDEQYHHAQEELRQLEERLHRIQQQHPLGAKGFTKAGIRKMIARLHEELALYEGSLEVRQAHSS